MVGLRSSGLPECGPTDSSGFRTLLTLSSSIVTADGRRGQREYRAAGIPRQPSRPLSPRPCPCLRWILCVLPMFFLKYYTMPMSPVSKCVKRSIFFSFWKNVKCFEKKVNYNRSKKKVVSSKYIFFNFFSCL